MSKTKVYTREQLQEMTVDTLRPLALYDFDIHGVSKARKDVIIDEIIKAQSSTQSQTPESTPQPLTRVAAFFTSEVTKPGEKLRDRLTTTVRVSCGATSGTFDVVGKSVGEVMTFLQEVLNIEKLSRGIVNGIEKDGSYVLKSGDTLEFLKPAGTKGL